MKTTFTTNISGESSGPTGIEVPADSIAALGSSKKPAVKVNLPGYSYRSTVAVMGGKFMIPLSAAHRTAAKLKAGDPVEVTLELDSEPRTVEIPEDLAAALAEKQGASEAFALLAPSRKKEYVRQIVEAKAEETRQRRIAKIVAEI